ncbi:MAG: S1/P1 nuclease [Gemmatimonadales bacterium]|jgi:hypothetical protein|nr:S1/P1 nuclease [Gemmatimonadales bacterium]
MTSWRTTLMFFAAWSVAVPAALASAPIRVPAPLGPLPTAAATVWGANGHRIVAAIAERYLLPATSQRVHALLGPFPLARFGEWGDKYRASPAGEHTATWHYVNIPDGESYRATPFTEPRDLIQALQLQERILVDTARSDDERAVALKLLLHFIADVHQPMHVGRAEDRGGNLVQVRWFGTPTNLHTVWDSYLLDHQGLSYTEYVAFLDFATAAEIEEWQRTDYVAWAMESMAFRSTVYDLPTAEPGQVPGLSWDYADRMTPIMERRLLQAGIRLAGVLNRVLGPPPQGR